METEKSSSRAEAPTCVTRDIRVTVRCTPLTDESNPAENVFGFSYTITIENLGQEVVQLIERHWRIFSAERQIGEVIGPGVVGKQPTLRLGEQHTYTSGAVIHDPYGYMFGEYTFRTESGEFFEVSIPRFELVFPTLLH